ncbi:MAG: hypothetical protein NTV52_02345 [Acidobacteria bacterium]|nr:hypothetical protein [Acidobacteriota bacterium]
MNKSRMIGVIVLLLAAAGARAQSGAKYGARDPQKCGSTKEPAKGVLSADLAKRYFACHVEREFSGNLYLVDNVTLEVGKGTSFKELPGGSRPFEADPDGLVYQVRGSFLRYSCSAESDFMRNKGKNCDVEKEEKATGTCFRNGFGDWICNVIQHGAERVTGQPPPRR